MSQAQLILEDGSRLLGNHFGAPLSNAGEVVFNTGMVGYAEAMTDPSYRGQLLVMTYPLIGNYGVPLNGEATPRADRSGLLECLESNQIQISGLVVATLSKNYSHWSALDSLDSWMQRQGVPGICNVDTRMLTKKLRNEGVMLGKILVDNVDHAWQNPAERNLVSEASITGSKCYPGSGRKKIVLVDFGCKESIVRHLVSRGLEVLRVPWNYDWSRERADGVVLSNGPGDPKMCVDAIKVLRKGLEGTLPILGICLGHQLLALAVGADTFKLKYGHRGQNQPCIQVGTKRCFITSQNHGFAVDEQTLPPEWEPWFFNANDGTNEGMRHYKRPVFSVQFHPEANPGPTETSFVFDSFLDAVDCG